MAFVPEILLDDLIFSLSVFSFLGQVLSTSPRLASNSALLSQRLEYDSLSDLLLRCGTRKPVKKLKQFFKNTNIVRTGDDGGHL